MSHSGHHTHIADNPVRIITGAYFDQIASYVYSDSWIIGADGNEKFRELFIENLSPMVVEAIRFFFTNNPQALEVGYVPTNTYDSDFVEQSDGILHPYLSPVKGWSADDLRIGDIVSIVQIISGHLDLARRIYLGRRLKR